MINKLKKFFFGGDTKQELGQTPQDTNVTNEIPDPEGYGVKLEKEAREQRQAQERQKEK